MCRTCVLGGALYKNISKTSLAFAARTLRLLGRTSAVLAILAWQIDADHALISIPPGNSIAPECSLHTSSDSQRRSTMPMSKEEREMRKASREQREQQRATQSSRKQQRSTESNRDTAAAFDKYCKSQSKTKDKRQEKHF